MMTINMTFVQLMVIEPPIAESVMSIYGFQIPFLLEPRTWLHGTISKISPVLTTFPDHILSNPLPYLYFYTSLFSVFSALLSYECNSNSCFNLTTTFSFYLSNRSHFLFLSLKPFSLSLSISQTILTFSLYLSYYSHFLFLSLEPFSVSQTISTFSFYLSHYSHFLFLSLIFLSLKPFSLSLSVSQTIPTFSFYLSNHFSLLVKEQARRLKLVDVPRHPWIIHHLAAAAARQASASSSQGGGSSTALNGVKK